jgi:acyl-coenzyme A synthetase/AMP-(fatty) acid ligase
LAKGIVNNQRSLLQRVLQHVQASHANSEDVFLLLSSLCTIAGTREALTALLTGSRLVIIDPEMAGLRAIRKTIHDQGISILYAVPALISAVIDAATTEDDFRSLRIVRLGGDRVLWSDIAAVRRVVSPGCHIQIGYSSTETTGTQWFVPSRFPESSPVAPVGYVLPGIDFAIVDDGDSPVASGEVGELVIRSRYVALGQWHKGRCACGAITVDPGNPELRIFRTGDLIRKREDGLMEVMGRKDRQIKIHGKRVEPAELEATLRCSAEVSDAAVIARRSDEQTCLVAFVAPMPGASPCLLSNLGAAIRAGLPAPLHPARLHLLQSIPRLPSAKLDIQALLEADDKLKNLRDGPSRLPDPGDSSAEIRAIVERIWGKLLG